MKDWDFSKPSRAVVVCDGKGTGAVLWHVGGDLFLEIDAAGTALDDLGLDDAPIGISVWEGRFTYEERASSSGEPVEDAVAEGTFRPPTGEEWKAIHEARPPWNPDEWMVDVPDEDG